MFGTPACVVPYHDAGKACTDSTNCTGLCKAAATAKVGERNVTGTCQRDSHDVYGCYDEVKGGTVVAGMCFD